MAHITDTLPFGHTLASKFETLHADWQDHMKRRKVYRQTLRELRQLSARELNDIGINPANITSVAREAAKMI